MYRPSCCLARTEELLEAIPEHHVDRSGVERRRSPNFRGLSRAPVTASRPGPIRSRMPGSDIRSLRYACFAPIFVRENPFTLDYGPDEGVATAWSGDWA